MDSQATTHFSAARRVLACFMVLRQIDPYLEMSAATAFLYIATHQGCSARDIREYLGMSQNAVNQLLHKLMVGEGQRGGYNLVSRQPSPQDSRIMLYSLAPKGLATVQFMASFLK